MLEHSAEARTIPIADTYKACFSPIRSPVVLKLPVTLEVIVANNEELVRYVVAALVMHCVNEDASLVKLKQGSVCLYLNNYWPIGNPLLQVFDV